MKNQNGSSSRICFICIIHYGFCKYLETCYPVIYADNTELKTSKRSVEELEISTFV